MNLTNNILDDIPYDQAIFTKHLIYRKMKNLKDGYDIVKLDIRDNKSVRIYTLEKRNSMVLCYVVLGSERSITNCYAP